LTYYAGTMAQVTPTTPSGSHPASAIKRTSVTGSLHETYTHMTTKLNQEAGITMILVTHEPGIATDARRVLSFKDDRLVRDEQVEQPRRAQKELKQLLAVEG